MFSGRYRVFNIFMTILLAFMLVIWCVITWDFIKTRDVAIERLKREYRTERITECKKLLGWEGR